MALSRKRKRELERLRKAADALLQEQRAVLGHATTVMNAASLQARALSDEHLAPRVKAALAQANAAATGVRKTVAPVIGAVLAQAVNAMEKSESASLRKAGSAAVGYGRRLGLIETPAKRGIGVGGAIAIGVGALAAVGVGYALWQTFRADDELWVATDEGTIPEA